MVGVATPRDEAFLRARRPDVQTQTLSLSLDDDLTSLAAGDLHALLVPGSSLIRLERRGLLETTLEPNVFTPAPGQGSLGLVVREDDFLAADLSYTLQHRPSFDRATAERAFSRPFSEPRFEVGALASVSDGGRAEPFRGARGRDERPRHPGRDERRRERGRGGGARAGGGRARAAQGPRFLSLSRSILTPDTVSNPARRRVGAGSIINV